MASTPEAKVKKKIRQILDSFGRGVYYAMPIGSGYGNAGVPDFLVCAGGAFVGIEAKAGAGKTTALQELNLAKIKNAGGVSLVIREENFKQLQPLLEDLIHGKSKYAERPHAGRNGDLSEN